MWAKNDTLAKVTSCEVSPVCRRLHWLAVSQLLRCGNDVAGALYGWLAGWLVGVKVTARTIVVFALLYASRAPSDPVLWLCSRGSITECEREREGERERDGFRERHVRWNRSGYIGSPVMRIRLDVSSKVEFFSVDLWAAFFFVLFCTCARWLPVSRKIASVFFEVVSLFRIVIFFFFLRSKACMYLEVRLNYKIQKKKKKRILHRMKYANRKWWNISIRFTFIIIFFLT